MLLVEYACRRLRAVLDEIGHVEEAEFPYAHSRDGLARIRELLERHLSTLSKLPQDKTPSIVKGLCAEALTEIFTYLPLLGFILRSTNVRNAFEVYGPLLRLARKILQGDTKLILSSEWRNYSPFTYRSIPALPNFVLIGFPAPESANPLLLPLAGHEFGHTVWRVNSCALKYRQRIEASIVSGIETAIKEYQELFPNHNLKAGEAQTNIFVRQTIALPTAWALKQSEEYFCDFIGLYLFDQAYLHAFAYLVAPSPAGERSVLYPNFMNRVTQLVVAANRFRAAAPESYDSPPGFSDLFQDQTEPSPKERAKRLFLSLADRASAGIADLLIDDARTLGQHSGFQPLTVEAKGDVIQAFKFIVPANKSTLVAIVNAGWEVFHDDRFWEEINMDSKERILKELMLKNIEVLEIEAITA